MKITISIILQKIFWQNYSCGNIKGVAWQYLCEIYFCDWAKLFHMAGFRYGSVSLEHDIRVVPTSLFLHLLI